MSELKIKIKEYDEVGRELTLCERALILCDSCFVRTSALDRLGYVWDSYLSSPGLHGCAKFKTETIRDATDEESMAYHFIESRKLCCSFYHPCDTCIVENICHRLTPYYESCIEILHDKEIILELVE